MKKTNKNTKNKQKIKKNKTKRTKNTKKSRKNVKKGGEYIDEGTFGKIYANPRLLCKGEDLSTSNIYDEVSKIFQYDRDAIDENNNIENLKKHGILEELEKYAIIPKKMCDVNRAVLMEPPYSDESWKKNKNSQYNGKIFNGKYATLPNTEEYNKLIISDKGGDNLQKIMEEIETYDDFTSFLKKLTSIGEGIRLLQENGFIHGDIKDKNCLEHNGTFKIIDLSDVREISNTRDPAAMPTAFGYHIWPITAFYTYLFAENVEFNNIEEINDIITLKQIKKNFYKGNDDNYNVDAISYVKVLFNCAFRTENIRYTEDQYEMINQIKKDLMLQKTTFIDFIDDNEVLLEIIEYFNQMFIDKFKDINEFKMDLFKRIDVYSFGIMILQCICQYLDINNNKIEDPVFCEKMIKLYGIVYKCCYQMKKVADINEIIYLYREVVDTM